MAFADGVGSDEDVADQPRFHRRTQRTCIGDNEAEAVAVHGEASGDEILFILVGRGVRQGVAIGVQLKPVRRRRPASGDECRDRRERLRASRVRGRAA